MFSYFVTQITVFKQNNWNSLLAIRKTTFLPSIFTMLWEVVRKFLLDPHVHSLKTNGRLSVINTFPEKKSFIKEQL